MDLPDLPDLPEFPTEVNNETMEAWISEVQRVASETCGRKISRGTILITLMLAVASQEGLISDREVILRLAQLAGDTTEDDLGGLEIDNAETMTENDFEAKRDSDEYIELTAHVRRFLERRDMWFGRAMNYIGVHRDVVLNTEPGAIIATSCLIQGRAWFNMDGLDDAEVFALDNAIRVAVFAARKEIASGN